MRVKAYIDGSSLGNPGPAGIGIVIKNEDETDTIATLSLSVGYNRTSNEAEYEAAIELVSMLRWIGVTEVDIHSDSKLVVNQINGTWKCKNQKLEKLRETFYDIISRWTSSYRGKGWTISHIPRSENTEADALARKASLELAAGKLL